MVKRKFNFKEFKERWKNPRPEVLAKIEYQSHIFSILGNLFACGMLIYMGLWYIIFAIIFNIGISYAQGMTAYKKYKAILNLIPKELPEDIENDISPSRRRSRIVQFVFGKWAKWISIIISLICTTAIFFYPIYNADFFMRIILSLVYTITIFLMFLFFYLFVFYWIAKPIYLKRINNDKKETN